MQQAGTVQDGNSLRESGRATPGALAVDGGVLADSHGSVGADVVLVGTVLAALSSDTLQLLLRGRVRVANLHHEALLSDGNAVVVLNNFLTDFTRLETGVID